MKLKEKGFRLVLLLMVLIVMSSVVLACGGDNDKTPARTPISTTTSQPALTNTAAATPAVATTPTLSKEPVKIGIIQAWSGPGAMSGWLSDAVSDLFDWYMNNEQGGILIGGVRRPVEFVKCDMQSTVAQAAACATKLIDNERVSIITEGGTTPSHFYPIADITDPAKMPFVHFGTNPLGPDYHWTATTISTGPERAKLFADFLINTLKAHSVSLLGEEMADGREVWSNLKPMLEKAGVDIKSESWVNPGTTDLSSYLTKIKYEKPDVLFAYMQASAYAAMYKQIMELGGWGDIQNFAGNEHSNTPSIAGLPGANGSYSLVSYMPGSDDPGVVAFENAWAQHVAENPGFGKKYRPAPLSTHPYFWNTFVVAKAAIELAGSDDPAEIAKALRSGELEVDTPFGPMHIKPDGSASVKDKIAQIQNGGKLITVK